MDKLKENDQANEAANVTATATERIIRSKSSPAFFHEPKKEELKTSTQDVTKKDTNKPSTPECSQILEKDWTVSLNASLDSAEWNCDTLIGDLSTNRSRFSLSSSVSTICSSSSDDTTILLSSSTETLTSSEEDNEASKPAFKKLKK